MPSTTAIAGRRQQTRKADRDGQAAGQSAGSQLPGTAANLTAYVCGIDTSDTSWSIAEINRLLFLRSLARSGQWGDREGAPSQQDWPAAA